MVKITEIKLVSYTEIDANGNATRTGTVYQFGKEIKNDYLDATDFVENGCPGHTTVENEHTESMGFLFGDDGSKVVAVTDGVWTKYFIVKAEAKKARKKKLVK